METNLNFQNIYTLIFISTFLLFVASYIIKLTLQHIGNMWASTQSNLYTIFLLPQIAFVITKVISGNIALSLGMIGALSIVRFRHPVKSPLELTIYFALITLGISMSVSLKWGVYLVIIVATTIILIFYLHKNKNINNLANFNKDESIILEVHSSIEISELYKANELKNYDYDKSLSRFVYRLVFFDKNEAENLINSIRGHENIEKITKSFN